MSRFGRRIGAAAVAATVLSLVVSTTSAGAVTPRNPISDAIEQAPAELVRTAAAARTSVPLTLITGDTVHVGIDADGQPVVHTIDQAPRADGRPVVFHTITREQRVYVVPGDALSLLGADVLDWELFNLVELGKHAANGTLGEVPVIVDRPAGISARQAPAAAPGATLQRRLPSIDAAAMTVDGDGTWWQAVQAGGPAGAAPAARATATGPLAGVEKVWLNSVVQVSLDESVPQIGAGVAWDLGFDGSGVTVAVLDTGIDVNHPDVAGKVVGQRDFINNDDDAADGHGHGTHVAATVAGTGAASDGLRPGVAPGADLLIGKVLSDGGSGTFDQIIAGMEWAAQSGAPIVSMSLGGGPTDGTDPGSQAVNQLSAQHGTLFVIAAGNSGPGAYTVATPGAADAALTVAAVDKADEMASFSSRGPRLGDDALKPDIAGPGVNVVAARAAGTAMGTVVDDFYTTASGTSMATPHVAGAAALVAQQNPELTGSELKGLLMGTSLDLGHSRFAQGAGRVDVGRAIDPTVFSDGNVSFGRFEYPHHPVTDTITYINVTDAPITLDLAGSLTAGDGTPGPDGLLTLSAAQVTVPANGTTQVEVTVDGSVLGDGDAYGPYSGVVNATDAAGDLRATSRVSAFLEPQRFDVTVHITAPDGATEVDYGELAIMPVDAQVSLHDDPAVVPGAETSTARLFDGSYAVVASVSWKDDGGQVHTAVPTAPEVQVAGSEVTVELDLDQARQVRTDVGTETETYQAHFGQERVSETGAWAVSSTLTSTYQDGEPNWWALPSEPVSLGTFSFTSQEVLVPPLVTIKALGGGHPISLHPRYHTPDATVSGGTQQWPDGETTMSREVRLPVPKLAGLRPSKLVHAGTGTPEELDGARVNRALVLLTPTDICGLTCNFPALRERVAGAADRGAAAVLVAGQTGRVNLGTVPAPTVECPDGPDSCPPVEPYSAIPIASLPADEAGALVDRLAHRDWLLAFTHGRDELPRAYALSHATSGQVPDGMPWRAHWWDLDRVGHRFHADQPGTVTGFNWQPAPANGAVTASLGLPLTATQAALPVYLGPSDGEVIHRYTVATAAYAEPMVLDPATGQSELQDHLPDGGWRETVAWNLRPFTPGAAPQPVTGSGFSLAGSMCAGCREGDVLYPVLYRTTGGGAKTWMTGMVNDTGIATLFLGEQTCDPPLCELHLFDADGNEIEQRLIPVAIRIGSAGQLSTTGFGGLGGLIDEETNR